MDNKEQKTTMTFEVVCGSYDAEREDAIETFIGDVDAMGIDTEQLTFGTAYCVDSDHRENHNDSIWEIEVSGPATILHRIDVEVYENRGDE